MKFKKFLMSTLAFIMTCFITGCFHAYLNVPKARSLLYAALIMLAAYLIIPRKGLRVTIYGVDKMTGSQFEEFCARVLQHNGYHNVRVQGGSGDQGVDILATKKGKRYAVQCKCYSHDLDNTPVQEVAAGKVHYHCDYAIVMTNRYFTTGAHQLARSNNVKLIDRDELMRMM